MTAFLYLSRLGRPQNLPILFALLLLSASVLVPPIDLNPVIEDIQITFDITQSMNVTDVALDQNTVSRLSLAKAAARSLILSLPCGSRVGWSVFTGHRAITLITPLEVCRHYAGLLASLTTIDGRMRWVEASNVGKGLHQAMRAAQSIGDNVTIVFISDGHEAPPLRTGQSAMPASGRFDLDGLIVGVGGDIPAPIPKTDAEGEFIGFWQAEDVVQQTQLSAGHSSEELSQLHQDHLIRLAQQANLNYVKLDSAHTIADALDNTRPTMINSVPLDLRWLASCMALLVLCWRFLPLT